MSDDRIVVECPTAEGVALNDLAEPGQVDEQLRTGIVQAPLEQVAPNGELLRRRMCQAVCIAATAAVLATYLVLTRVDCCQNLLTINNNNDTNETTTDKDKDDRIVFEEKMPIEELIHYIKSNSIEEGTPEQQPDDDLSSDGGKKLKNQTWRTQPANDGDDLTSDGGRKLNNTTWHAKSESYKESAPPADEEDRIVYEE